MEELAKEEYNKKKKPSKVNSCLSHFSDFCNQTSIHGLGFVGNSKLTYIERILFGSIFVLYLTVSIYFVVDSYRKWAEHPIIIGINPEPTFIDDIPFPAVTICNVNQVRHSKVRDFPKDSAEYELMQTICQEDNTANRTQSRHFKVSDYLKAVTHPCNETVLQCKFGGLQHDCNKLFQATFTDDGMCCTFNAIDHSILYKTSETDFEDEKIKPWNPEIGYPKEEKDRDGQYHPITGPGTGVSMGLTIILNAQSEDYYCSNSNGVGFKLAVHSPNDIPRIKVNVPVGAESRIRVSPDITSATNAIRSINRKYRNCVFLNEKKLQGFMTYSKRNCEMECETNLTYAKCNCIRYFQPHYIKDAEICGTKNYECARNVTLLSRQQWAEETNCNIKCPPTCFDITYRQDIFTTPIRLGKFLINDDEILRTFKPEYVEDNIAILNFFYENSEYYGFIQSEFTGMTDFFSSTGGLMGLFLGFSCVSLIEIIYFCTLRPFFHKKNKKLEN